MQFDKSGISTVIGRMMDRFTPDIYRNRVKPIQFGLNSDPDKKKAYAELEAKLDLLSASADKYC